MIQDIQPHLFNNTYIATSVIKETDYVFHFKGNALLLDENMGVSKIPQKQDLVGCPSEGTFLFTLNAKRCFLVSACNEQKNSSFIYHPIKYPHTITKKEVDWASAVAVQLKDWYDQHQYCGKCGAPTQHKSDERAIECTSCQHLIFPSISPAIIVAIISKDKILLARGTNFREGFYSLIAGYLDVGESIEETVGREVKEEVGLNVKNVRFYKSQPWPFSGSMMLGFIAELDGDAEIQIDGKEIMDAKWFQRDELPAHPNTRSIAGEIIEMFKSGEI